MATAGVSVATTGVSMATAGVTMATAHPLMHAWNASANSLVSGSIGVPIQMSMVPMATTSLVTSMHTTGNLVTVASGFKANI